MGSTLSADLATMNISREDSIAMQLRGNHYPPVPLSMVQPCIEAIDAYNDDEPNKLIELPEGVSWRGENSAPAIAIIEGHHLDAWCNHADWCDCEDCIYTEE
jgi:hypothetical protein